MGDSRDVTSSLRDLLAAGRVLALTGAGISTDSGIPDYRGPDGRLRHTLPMTYDRFVSSVEERRRYWARSHLGWARLADARPNAAHHALTELQQTGLVTAVVTQNVDGLHTAARSRDVIDLHGRLDVVVCLGCRARRPRLEVALRLDAVNPGFRRNVTAQPGVVRPDGDVVLSDDVVRDFRLVDCRRCGGVLKPDVVFFGESVPRQRFTAALGMLGRSASLLVLGSSLTVGSGYRFVTAAAQRGLPVAIVNRGETRGDRHADLKFDAALADAFLPAVRAIIPATSTISSPTAALGRG